MKQVTANKKGIANSFWKTAPIKKENKRRKHQTVNVANVTFERS